MKKCLKTIAAFAAIVMVLVLLPATPLPKADAATITLYPANYTYVKPAPYWTCDPCDEFGTGQQVTILWRDYNFFYIEYTRNGVLKRGFAAMSHFNSADYKGYSWASYDYFVPAQNNTGSTANVRYGPSTSYSVSGSIDSNEGNDTYTKPLTLLQKQGSWSFIQYVTNPGESGHPKYKRGWVETSKITCKPQAAVPVIDANNYVLIKNVGTGTYLQLNGSLEDESGYQLYMAPGSGSGAQHWYVPRFKTLYDNTYTDYCYKLIGFTGNMAWEVNGKIPVLNQKVIATAESNPNKAQEFYFKSTGDSHGSFRIFTRCSGGHLALQANTTGTAVYQERYAESDYQKWVIIPFDAYHDTIYSSIPKVNDIAQFKYYIVTTGVNAVSKADITSSLIRSAVSYWNSKKAQTGVELVETTSASDAHLSIISSDIGSAAGETTTSRAKSEDENGNEIYYFINAITKLSQSALQNKTTAYKEFVVCHELGHAMGLDHTAVYIDANNISNSYYLYRSIMNDGNYYYNVTNSNYRTDTPTNYDYRTLQCKWKGAKNT